MGKVAAMRTNCILSVKVDAGRPLRFHRSNGFGIAHNIRIRHAKNT